MIRQLNALSGIAIVLVVLHHAIDLQIGWFNAAGILLEGNWQLPLLVVLHRLGKVAVPLFLFISGGFIAYAARGNPPKLSWQSVQAALRRLFWPYLVWSLIFYIVIYFQRQESYSALGYLKNLLVGYPFHFVPLLLFFYAIAVPLAALARRYGLALLGVGLVGQFALLAVVYPGIYGVDLPAWTSRLAPPILGGTLALWGIYFPLGLIYALNSKQLDPWLQRGRWLLVALTLGFYLLDVLHTLEMVRMPLAVHIYPLTFVLLTPLIKRQAIPKVTTFEYVGKRSYGLYLIHLIVIDLTQLAVQNFAPWLVGAPLLLALLCFGLALALPLLMMHSLSTTFTRMPHRYVFG